MLGTAMVTGGEGAQEATAQQACAPRSQGSEREQRDEAKPFDELYQGLKRTRKSEGKLRVDEEPRQTEEALGASSRRQAQHERSPPGVMTKGRGLRPAKVRDPRSGNCSWGDKPQRSC